MASPDPSAELESAWFWCRNSLSEEGEVASCRSKRRLWRRERMSMVRRDRYKNGAVMEFLLRTAAAKRSGFHIALRTVSALLGGRSCK